jgi:hypothetical protein
MFSPSSKSSDKSILKFQSQPQNSHRSVKEYDDKRPLDMEGIQERLIML